MTRPILAARRAWRRLAPRAFRSAAAGWVQAGRRPYLDWLARQPWDSAPGPDPVQVAGFLSASHGIGSGARLTLRAFKALGAPASAVDLTGLGEEDLAPSLGASHPAAWILHLNPPELLDALALAGGALRGPRYGAWAWELPRAPAGWRGAARGVDEVWAPSRYAAAAFAPFGRPVRTVLHPLVLDDYAHIAPATRRADFTAVMLFDFNSSMARKNPLGAIAAFRQAFRDDPTARLVIKTQNGAQHPGMLERLRGEAGPQVEVLDAVWPYPEVLALIRSADVLLSLHRAEGFGLTMAEAMAMGVCVLATEATGNLDFMDRNCALLVPAGHVQVADPQGIYQDQVWAEPDIGAAAGALRRLRSDPDLGVRLASAAQRRVAATLGPVAWFQRLPASLQAWVRNVSTDPDRLPPEETAS